MGDHPLLYWVCNGVGIYSGKISETPSIATTDEFNLRCGTLILSCCLVWYSSLQQLHPNSVMENGRQERELNNTSGNKTIQPIAYSSG